MATLESKYEFFVDDGKGTELVLGTMYCSPFNAQKLIDKLCDELRLRDFKGNTNRTGFGFRLAL